MSGMTELLRFLSENKDGLWWAIGSILLILFNISKIFDFIDSRKRKRITLLEEALKCSNLDKTGENFYIEELNKERFKILTGLAMEKNFRQKIIKIIGDADGRLPIRTVSKASPFLKYDIDQDKVYVHVDWVEILSFSYNFLFGLILVIMGVVINIMALFVGKAGPLEAMTWLGYGCASLIFGVLLMYQILPWVSAKKVEKHLKRIELPAGQDSDLSESNSERV